MTFPLRTPLHEPIEHGYEIVQLEDLPASTDAPADAGLREALRTGDAATLERLSAELQQTADRGGILPATHLTRLLDALGDADLRPDNPAAAPYLRALSRIKAKRSGLLARGAGKWSEVNVASALALTYPGALRHKVWVADDQRPGAIARWIGRVSAFAGAGLIGPRTTQRLLLRSPSATPLAHQALKHGDAQGREFAAVMAGFKNCAVAGALKGPDFLRLLHTTDEGWNLPDTVFRRGNLEHLRAFLDMALGARQADALGSRELLDLLTKTGSGHPVLARFCHEAPHDAARLEVHLLALAKAERAGHLPADTVAGVLLTRDDNGKFLIERAGRQQAATIRRVLDTSPERLISETAAGRIRELLRA